MKKTFILSVAFQATPAYVLKKPAVFPGVFKIVDTANGHPLVPVAFVILNQNASQGVDDQAGWNWTTVAACSKKANPNYVDGTATPTIPSTIPANYKSADEAYDAYVAGANSVAYE